jgi:hypothetical protein
MTPRDRVMAQSRRREFVEGAIAGGPRIGRGAELPAELVNLPLSRSHHTFSLPTGVSSRG